jgi:hypothetical protein
VCLNTLQEECAAQVVVIVNKHVHGQPAACQALSLAKDAEGVRLNDMQDMVSWNMLVDCYVYNRARAVMQNDVLQVQHDSVGIMAISRLTALESTVMHVVDARDFPVTI